MTKLQNKLIIGLIGEMGSGKDTVADYIGKKYKSQSISFSQPLRDILDRIYLPQSRKNMVALGTLLRKQFGNNLIAKTIIEEIGDSKAKIVCLPNVRLKEDITKLKKLDNFLLISIEAEPKTRYTRITKRSQNSDDKTKTWKQFLTDSKLLTEIGIKNLAKKAQFNLDNNGNYRQLYVQIDEAMKQIKKKK
jgi:dephospho-CoA kinase